MGILLFCPASVSLCRRVVCVPFFGLRCRVRGCSKKLVTQKKRLGTRCVVHANKVGQIVFVTFFAYRPPSRPLGSL